MCAILFGAPSAVRYWWEVCRCWLPGGKRMSVVERIIIVRQRSYWEGELMEFLSRHSCVKSGSSDLCVWATSTLSLGEASQSPRYNTCIKVAFLRLAPRCLFSTATGCH